MARARARRRSTRTPGHLCLRTPFLTCSSWRNFKRRAGGRARGSVETGPFLGEEGDGTNLDALACRGLWRGEGVVERRVEHEARPVLLLVVDLEDEALVLDHPRVVVPLVLLVRPQGVVLARPVGEQQLVEEEVLLGHRPRVAHRERETLHGRFQDVAPHVDEREALVRKLLDVRPDQLPLPQVRADPVVGKLHQPPRRAVRSIVAMHPGDRGGGPAGLCVQAGARGVADRVVEDHHTSRPRGPLDQLAHLRVVAAHDLVVVAEIAD
mmetsp:Transcript_111012/g.314910  ORF Transcript_111012/g.314910 Transcript_111012/m.314910 type:complete len:267 (-) Transcript_111012:258-1058(-)